ncbi:keratin, type II cytoskeletal 80 [Manacus vitellinus]|uniref:keratin, type II cytoskeletal 80 n=1 Tax=Manacus vitellinus TaxID=328815 RepID=UPI00115EE2BB|nr:keratin, type II cytoskeletal 80 [Manacus vitellinus]
MPGSKSRQVQDLEQQNKVLTTRWNFLKEQDNSQSDADVRAIYEQFMGRMSQERKALSLEQENLERELEKVLGTMDAFRSKYEDEIRLCSGMEFTFMELKKELQELLSELKDISVVLGIDPSCPMDLSRVVEDVRAQYESLARHSWIEAEALSRRKLSEGHSQAGTFGGHLLESRREIAELNIRIQKLRSGIVSQRSQCLFLEEHIREGGEQGDTALGVSL